MTTYFDSDDDEGLVEYAESMVPSRATRIAQRIGLVSVEFYFLSDLEDQIRKYDTSLRKFQKSVQKWSKEFVQFPTQFLEFQYFETEQIRIANAFQRVARNIVHKGRMPMQELSVLSGDQSQIERRLRKSGKEAKKALYKLQRYKTKAGNTTNIVSQEKTLQRKRCDFQWARGEYSTRSARVGLGTLYSLLRQGIQANKTIMSSCDDILVQPPVLAETKVSRYETVTPPMSVQPVHSFQPVQSCQPAQPVEAHATSHECPRNSSEYVQPAEKWDSSSLYQVGEIPEVPPTAQSIKSNEFKPPARLSVQNLDPDPIEDSELLNQPRVNALRISKRISRTPLQEISNELAEPVDKRDSIFKNGGPSLNSNRYSVEPDFNIWRDT